MMESWRVVGATEAYSGTAGATIVVVNLLHAQAQ